MINNFNIAIMLEEINDCIDKLNMLSHRLVELDAELEEQEKKNGKSTD